VRKNKKNKVFFFGLCAKNDDVAVAHRLRCRRRRFGRLLAVLARVRFALLRLRRAVLVIAVVVVVVVIKIKIVVVEININIIIIVLLLLDDGASPVFADRRRFEQRFNLRLGGGGRRRRRRRCAACVICSVHFCGLSSAARKETHRFGSCCLTFVFGSLQRLYNSPLSLSMPK
jgi:hypothetical protein